MLLRATIAAVTALLVFGSAGASAASITLDIPHFSSEDDALKHCQQDTVVWLNTASGTYTVKGDRSYGVVQPGTYVCQKDADIAGFTPAAKTGKESSPQTTAAPAAQVGTAVFDTLIPLQDRDMTYDCGQGRQFEASGRAFDQKGGYKITYTWSGLEKPIAPASFLAAHDAANDVDILGYFDAKGSLSPLAKPALAIPLQPSPGFHTQLPQRDGSTYTRKWVGSSSVAVPYGAFAVEIYTETVAGIIENDSFADKVGLVQIEFFSKDKPFLTCDLTKIDAK